MPGVRRRLRDVTKKVSGVLGGPRDEGAEEGTAAPAEPSAPAAAEDPSASAAAEDPSAPAAAEDRAVAPLPSEEDLSVTVAPPQTALAADDVPPAAPAEPRAVDERCAAAVDLARAAAAEVADTAVGDHLGVEAEDEPGSGHVATHWFASTDPAYVGWRWAVSVARADGSEHVTVDDVVLLPGTDALLAPAWVPWSERVQPDDLGPGDLLPPSADDPRLVPAYADVDAERLPFDLHRELGLGRPRVLSLDGRADAAERWYQGEAGPDTAVAQAAPGRCDGCGFLAPLAGALGRVFGVCANAMAPDDGRVVAFTHGCGAHSETVVEQPESTYSGMAVELEELDFVDGEVDAGGVSTR